MRPFLVGSVCGFGWTPGVGPILAVVLTFAAVKSTVLKGVELLAVYAMGLALPSLLAAFSIKGFLSFYKRFQRHMHKLKIANGVTMIAVGLLVSTGHLVLLNDWLNNTPF